MYSEAKDVVRNWCVAKMQLLMLPEDLLHAVVPLSRAVMFAQVCRQTTRLQLNASVSHTARDVKLPPILSQKLVRIHTLHISNAMLDQHDLAVLAQNPVFCADLVDVDFWNNVLGPGAGVGKWLANCHHLERLNLNYNNLQASGMRALAGSLCFVSRLLDLHLDSNNVCNSGASSLASALGCVPFLQRLSLAANGIHDIGVQNLIVGLSACPGLIMLNLGNNHIHDLGSGFARHLTTVRELYLAWNQLDCHILPRLHALPCITRVDLTHNNLNEASAVLMPPPTTLVALDLSWNTLPGLPRVLTGLGRCAHLQSLCLNYTRLSNADVQHLDAMPMRCPELRVLELRGNLLTSTGCRDVIEAMALAPELRTLDLSLNRAFSQSTAVPAVLVRGSFSKLTRLGLSALKLSSLGAWWLRNILVHLSSLEELMLDRNQIESSSLSILYAGLENCTRLHTLKLSYNFLGHGFATGFGQVVQAYKGLVCLSLSHTYLTDRGLRAMVHCIGSCASLQRLGLSSNALSNASAIALVCGADFVWHKNRPIEVDKDIFPGLVHLDLPGNLIMDQGAMYLAAWLRARPLVKRLVLIDNLIDKTGIEAVMLARDAQRAAGSRVDVWIET